EDDDGEFHGPASLAGCRPGGHRVAGRQRRKCRPVALYGSLPATSTADSLVSPSSVSMTLRRVCCAGGALRVASPGPTRSPLGAALQSTLASIPEFMESL